ncbi:MAG TPA: arsenite methyltransferase [Nitrososphaeraceae archaeon]|jgi:ubiquinone/menaquinone biosynthesis C-methylase UbiE|nr:arsenite methyltransferase [Nitrososphaeraceae archaeon]
MQEQQLKERVKERYGKIALTGNSDCCCVPGECCDDSGINKNGYQSVIASTKLIGYDTKDIDSIPLTSVLGVGCGAPTKFSDIRRGEVIVDLGSGAGIDVFLASNNAGKSGKVIGIDMTDEMLDKARKNANDNGYTNVEFRKGDIEKRIPIEDNTADLALSNCVINLTTDKISTFKEIYRILKNAGGRMVVSDLVTDREIDKDAVNPEKWCSCIDGALTKENYLESIRKAGFKNVQILEEKPYMEEEQQEEQEGDNYKDTRRKISSLLIKAVKD